MSSEAGAAHQDQRSMRIGYVLSRFPKLTETFILYEILELQRQGVDVTIHALVRERAEAVHPEAERLLPGVEFPSAAGIIGSQVEWLLKRPTTYLRLWGAAFLANARSPRFLIRALATVPIGAWFATRMSRTPVDHVHAHWATHSALAAMVAARLLGIGFSFSAHAHDIYVDRSMLRQKIAAAAFVVTISEYNRRLLESLYPAETLGKLLVIHCGVDLTELAAPERDAAPTAPLRVVCVASLQPQKGQAVLVKAMALLRDRGVASRLTLVGDGPERSALQRAVAEAGLSDVVVLAGALPRPRVLDQLRDADVIAQPSVPIAGGKMEGIPVALMEGMAMGLPVVATEISGVPELVTDGESGYLVFPGDADALATALQHLSSDRASLRRMGTAARRAVAAGFDLQVTASALRQAFAEALSASSAQSRGDGSAEPEGQDNRDSQDDKRHQ